MYRVRYTDLSAADYDPSDKPAPLNVATIIQQNEEGAWHVRSGGDIYCLENGVWVEHDIVGFFQWAMDTGMVMFGRTMPNEKFAEVMRLSMQDRDELANG